MKNALTLFRPALKELSKNKTNLFLTAIPILIGAIAYYFIGTYFYETIMHKGQDLIASYVSEGTLGSVVAWVVKMIISILLFFAVNYTFVLFVSLIASPFNEMLSSRIEKRVKGEAQDDTSETFRKMISRLFSTLATEIKKISFIIFLSIIAFIIGYIPLLTPITFMITIILLAIGYLDYSWSRHDTKFSSCLNDIRKNVLSYLIGGAFFLILVSVPLVNLIVPPFATSYFTLLWLKNNEHSNKAS